MIQGLAAVLGNVDFRYKGDECSPNTYAYVYTNRPYNMNNGKYLFYLCYIHWSITEGVQIETMLHEGAHHEYALAKDSKVVINGKQATMYGKRICLYVADACKSGTQ